MTSEYLLDAVGRIDDDLVVEAAAVPRRSRGPWLRWGALAAAAALCVGIVGMSGLFRPKGMAKEASAPAAAEAEGTYSAAMAPRAADNATEDSAASSAQRSGRTAAAIGDVCKPTFLVGGVAYHLVSLPTFTEELPEGSVPLGRLELAPRGPAAAEKGLNDEDAPPFVNEESMVGRDAWLAPDGDLYIAGDAGYAHAAPMGTAGE